MKIAIRSDFSYGGYGVSFYRKAGSLIQYVSTKQTLIEWVNVSPNEAVSVDDAEVIRLERHDLLSLYDSLKEELERIGMIRVDESQKEVELIKKHLADAIKVRDQLLTNINMFNTTSVSVKSPVPPLPPSNDDETKIFRQG